ncbi:hypothetical protein NM688_g199 [Phlebia brevispora]|uniref:Uncharacterized protein n=1 Tax=Phlebia brevispora TaxID=194682 RepID=A0ACC1TFD2_9APHY|nr:hypothetical protein NM688_g199 [Phlebia brevispora]
MEMPNAIVTVASALKNELQQVEERCLQAQYKCEELRTKRAELLEVLHVFEMIEESEKAKTKQLEYELERAEQEATDRYRAALGVSGSLNRGSSSGDDVFGPTVPNNLAKDDYNEDADRHLLFPNAGAAPEKKTKTVQPRNVIPLFCKQMITSLLPTSEDLVATKIQTRNQSRETNETENIFTANPRAPLIPDANKGDGYSRKRQTKKVLALEKAKNKAAETFKTMPHKARRKLKTAHAPKFAPKKTLAYTGEALRSMASGFGTIGGLWNSHQRLEDELPASETWPEAVRFFLASGSATRVIGTEATNDRP